MWEERVPVLSRATNGKATGLPARGAGPVGPAVAGNDRVRMSLRYADQQAKANPRMTSPP